LLDPLHLLPNRPINANHHDAFDCEQSGQRASLSVATTSNDESHPAKDEVFWSSEGERQPSGSVNIQ
jgi:hypothetical protein